jgi:hypothetical protein
MTESIKKVSAVFSVILALLGVVFLALRTPDTDAETMHAKYGGDSPLFAKTPNGLSVHYRDQGCMNCPALILVHGSNASLHTFEPLVDKLKNRFRLISYDQPGHGLTGPHPRDDYSASGMIEALAAVIKTTGVERFTIVGWVVVIGTYQRLGSASTAGRREAKTLSRCPHPAAPAWPIPGAAHSTTVGIQEIAAGQRR